LPWNRWQRSHGINGSFAVESVAGLLWNQWQLSCGTGGSFGVESVAGFTWNRWQLWRGIRNRTMFLLMLRCGLRVGEVSGLPWAAIDFTQGTLRIDNSKGHVDRVVYLSPDVAKALRQWQRLQTAAAHYVFPSRMSRKGGLPLSARQIRNCMTRYLKLAGISKPYSPHSLRHTFATQLLNAGASLEVVKELMGHRSLDVTLRYTQLYDRTKRAQYDQAMRQVATRQGLHER
jgi:site-specific recombinase XerD